MMKKSFLFIVFLIIIIFIGAGFLLSNVSHQFSGPPVLVLSEEIGDLGTIKPDQKQDHIFTLKNEGGETLVIERVQATCGCTATVLSEQEIPSGKTADLLVTFNPRGYEGEVSKSIYIDTNDPENPRKKVSIKAVVEHIPSSEINLSVNLWDIGLLLQGDSTQLTLMISNQGDLDLSIEGIEIPDHIQYNKELLSIPKRLIPQEQLEVVFNYDSRNHEVGLVREYIRLVTNDPKRKTVTLRIDGYIRARENAISIDASPKILIDKDFNQSQYETKLLLKNCSESTLQLVSVQPSVDYLKIISNHNIILSPGESQEITLQIDQEKIADLYINERLQEYIYLNIALPVSIGPEIE